MDMNALNVGLITSFTFAIRRTRMDSEVSQSKECLSEHEIDPATITTFAVRHGNAVSNSMVINTVAKYYDMAINGFSNLMRLNCT
jgi:hypothetical protein